MRTVNSQSGGAGLALIMILLVLVFIPLMDMLSTDARLQSLVKGARIRQDLVKVQTIISASYHDKLICNLFLQRNNLVGLTLDEAKTRELQVYFSNSDGTMSNDTITSKIPIGGVLGRTLDTFRFVEFQPRPGDPVTYFAKMYILSPDIVSNPADYEISFFVGVDPTQKIQTCQSTFIMSDGSTFEDYACRLFKSNSTSYFSFGPNSCPLTVAGP